MNDDSTTTNHNLRTIRGYIGWILVIQVIWIVLAVPISCVAVLAGAA